MARGGFVAYYRVSTDRQARSGLGLEAQQQAVWNYLKAVRGQLISEHTEVEAGKKNDRPKLAVALAACRIHGATLIVAKLDRLSRNAAFLLALRDSGADFIAADMPEANRLTVGVLAVVAEHEREAISARTKVALDAARRRGVQLGNPAHLTHSARRLGTSASAKIRRARAAQRAIDLAPTIAELRETGASSLRSMAQALNGRGIPATRGGFWTAGQVRRLFAAHPAT
jgi:DNA invertase Pin-like site-specific DNA recombinase